MLAGMVVLFFLGGEGRASTSTCDGCFSLCCQCQALRVLWSISVDVLDGRVRAQTCRFYRSEINGVDL